MRQKPGKRRDKQIKVKNYCYMPTCLSFVSRGGSGDMPLLCRPGRSALDASFPQAALGSNYLSQM